ncbi:MAG: glycosyltransferase family 1 protein [Leptolyngbyaceae bacterium]|nr:glycosyltransferase family 1 protein [Leptolyngbyaceae bacterium]
MSGLIVNLAFLNQQPTGLMTYGVNVISHLRSLTPTLLTPQPFPEEHTYSIPATMTADQGSKGHARRLVWTQIQLPAIYRQLDASLLFSPIPEAPLGTRTRYVVTVHDVIPLRFPKRFSPLTLYSRYYVPHVLRQAQHILANSTATAEDVVKFFGIPASSITPIPLAYDAAHFRVLDVPKKNYFLVLGRPDPHKNIHRVLDAFAQLPHSDTELWLAGTPDPKLTPQLLIHADELGIRQRVKVLDYVPYAELPKLLNQAIALVFPSLWEGFGLPVLEAMACGTPVITSTLSSLPEVAGDAALLVDPYRGGAIAQAMHTILSDETAQRDLRTAGLQRVKHFSWEQTGRHTKDVLQKYL